MHMIKAFTLVTLGLAIGAMGFYVAQADDAPGAAAMGLVLMIAGLVLGLKAARQRLPRWGFRTALLVGVGVAGFAAVLTHAVSVSAALFPQARDIPSAATAAPAAQHAAAVERARALVRTAMLEQNLPGVSVAVGAGGALLWAEGFGWRDVSTEAAVTPATRFHVGTAASVLAPAASTLALPHTGVDTAADWSPEHVGEEEEDFPPLALLRHVVWQPLGLMRPEYPIAGDRATFYVPQSGSNPRTGRRLMAMRDLACCAANGQAFSSTPTDLVRVGLSAHPGRVDGQLAGGTVMSLASSGDGGVVVAVTSNIAHANTRALAQRIVETFAPSGTPPQR
ncbi:hypothetical protein TBR22_A11050 [Luteitalea sp. TBR-22]|uniref:beta-lactamase family protein n=1 Tax=Luteitalea sp. TBR-22 TaxID=2802971 RepID=UPI001AF23CD3|nr:beta-lactamase family protein [Luteitalea sp. TBR-22]BCS31902.1 hypothetical protein TBR22_A11050 [Luteitalea sp. TBR-22]